MCAACPPARAHAPRAAGLRPKSSCCITSTLLNGAELALLLSDGHPHELHLVRQQCASWFVDDAVREGAPLPLLRTLRSPFARLHPNTDARTPADGTLVLSTPLDPLFLLLPLLDAHRQKAPARRAPFPLRAVADAAANVCARIPPPFAERRVRGPLL